MNSQRAVTFASWVLPALFRRRQSAKRQELCIRMPGLYRACRSGREFWQQCSDSKRHSSSWRPDFSAHVVLAASVRIGAFQIGGNNYAGTVRHFLVCKIPNGCGCTDPLDDSCQPAQRRPLSGCRSIFEEQQTDFGIKPPGKAGVRAKDEVNLELSSPQRAVRKRCSALQPDGTFEIVVAALSVARERGELVWLFLPR